MLHLIGSKDLLHLVHTKCLGDLIPIEREWEYQKELCLDAVSLHEYKLPFFPPLK